jgi:hypothetical protein
MRQPNYLFSNADWFSVQDRQKKSLIEDVARFDGNRLLNTSVDDLCEYFGNKYRIDVPTLRENEIAADQKETQIDVSHDQGKGNGYGYGGAVADTLWGKDEVQSVNSVS